MRLVLGIHKYSRSLPLTTRILKVYVEFLMGFSHVHSPDGLISRLHPWSGVWCGNGGQNIYPKDRDGGKEPLIVQVQLVVTSFFYQELHDPNH